MIQDSIVNSIVHPIGNPIVNSIDHSIVNSIANPMVNSIDHSIVNSIDYPIFNSIVNSIINLFVNSVGLLMNSFAQDCCPLPPLPILLISLQAGLIGIFFGRSEAAVPPPRV